MLPYKESRELRMKLIIAGNVRQYQRYCRKHKLSPAEARYISDPDMLYGYKDPEIILYGSWWDNPAADEARRLRNIARKEEDL